MYIYMYYPVVVLVYSRSLSFSLFLTGTGTDRPQIVLASSALAAATFYPSITPPPPPIYLLVRARRQNILTNNRTPVGMLPLAHRPDQIYLAHRVRRRRRTSSSSSAFPTHPPRPPLLHSDAVRTTNSLSPSAHGRQSIIYLHYTYFACFTCSLVHTKTSFRNVFAELHIIT